MKELETQAQIAVGVEALWKALTRDLRAITPQVLPHVVKDVELIDGDGGVGTLIQFNYTESVAKVRFQKERVSELDERLRRIALEVVEGGQLELGFSSYTTTIQLSAAGEEETNVLVKISYEWETESSAVPTKNIESTVSFLKAAETFLTKGRG